MKNRSIKNVFHIGYHRTGTTFLQKCIFPQYSDEIFLPIIKVSYFKDNSNADMKMLRSLISSKEANSKLCVISNEGLSGSLLQDNLDIPGKIYGIIPDSKIIICIRSQYTMIPSLYSMYIKSKGTKTYSEYLNTVVKNNKLNYFEIAKIYCEKFGKDSVLVLLYEDLNTDLDKFLSALFSFVGLPKKWDLNTPKQFRNKRYPLFVLKSSRILNIVLESVIVKKYISESSINSIRRFFRKTFFAIHILANKLNFSNNELFFQENDIYKKIILKKYRNSNQQLSRFLNIDLGKYGYPI